MKDDNRQRLRDYALKLLSFRPRSQVEIEKKLLFFSAKRKIPENLTEELILDLKRKNLINDEEFALWWKDQRSRFKPKGLYAIKYELIKKGIEKEIIERIIDKKKNRDVEFEKARKLLSRKLSKFNHLNKKDIKIKLSDYLFRRGFDWDTIQRVIDSFMQKK